ncbi:MAG TPA: GDP-mannose 4,6-dehydratase [Sphingomonas sp.]|jgi:nucleoside-diphosphate-sugar epimerase
MRVLVTGALGFTGRYMTDALRAVGHDPIASASDITDPGAVADEVGTARPDAIIHLAASAFAGGDAIDEFYAVNQLGAFHVLDAAAKGCPGAHVVLASSAQVYGAQAAGLVREDAPTLPANHYGLSKLAGELGSAFFADRLRIAIVRPFNYTGVGQEARYLLPKIVDHVARGAAVIELGNTFVRRDFGDVRAVADAYVGLVETGAQGVFNVGTGRAWSIGDILRILERRSGHRLDVQVNPAFVRQNEVPELAGDIARLRAALPDWRPRDIEDTLAWMLDAARDAQTLDAQTSDARTRG